MDRSNSAKTPILEHRLATLAISNWQLAISGLVEAVVVQRDDAIGPTAN
jgi:hypothetical protein